MKILLFTQFFWPEVRTAPMNLAAVAEGLQAKGHVVTVMTGFPNHPFGRIYDGYGMRPWQWDDVRGVRVLRLPLFPDHSLSAARRALNYGSFALSAMTLGLLNVRSIEADVLYVYLPPLTMAAPAALLGRLLRAPLVYWITDLWPESLNAAGAPIGPRAVRAIRNLEDWAYRRAKTICVNSPGFKHNLIGKGVPAGKIEVVMDWADETLFFPTKPDLSLAQEFGLAGKFNVVYGGNLGAVQCLDTVVLAARLLQDLSDIQFVLIGDGTDEQNLKSRVAEYKLDNVRFVPRQPPEKMHRFFALADVLLVHLKREPIFEMQVPSKITAYLACGRPILCAVPGVAAGIVRDARGGVTCPSEDPPAMAEQIRILHAMPAPEREAMGQAGRQAYLEKYTRSLQVDRIEAILRQAAGGSQ